MLPGILSPTLQPRGEKGGGGISSSPCHQGQSGASGAQDLFFVVVVEYFVCLNDSARFELSP